MRRIEAPPRGLRRWAIAGIAIVILATAGVAATHTPLFAAGPIGVEGAGSIPRGEVLSIAGLGERSNVFHLDALSAERALERDPRILDARVTTSLPDRISIRIEPRNPVGVVGVPGTLVGADAVMIGPASARHHDLPVLRSEGGGAVTGGSLKAAAAAAGAMSAGLRGVVRSVTVRPDGALEVRLAAGFSAYLGDASELEAKAASLGALIDWAESEGARVVSADLAVPSSPTAQLERGSTAIPVVP